MPTQILTFIKVAPLVQLPQLPQSTLEGLLPCVPVDGMGGFQLMVFLQYSGLIVGWDAKLLKIPFELGLVNVKKRAFVGTA